ncbi:ABC transporter ATP-binding protein [Kribbella shirazensis]|uniref:ABC-2 type transport system ATP-binding protein n=1 Tax=Kribbella shirazensis TaxID=1105143 RepID=A0A7X5VEC0_9ACTN|nr:ATP-binding cassette domain-containing protein [Kribbella shirazensis]NIK59221.1 ABC-2 type transport system ATP-binding protein [Kribbella shirazensis]
MVDGSGRIVVSGLTKMFRTVRAVDDLSFTVEPGTISGFLGPNGAGKTTTLRCLLGLVTPTAGTATIGGLPYVDLPHPSSTVGAVLGASTFHPARSARNHLHVLCAVNGYPRARAADVLDQVGLTTVADRKVREYSTGMRQRLGLAAALLGDPGVLVLDEPANGLDPEGIAWLRAFLHRLAADGRTVLISSHVLSEVEQTVDHIVVIDKGRLIQQGGLADLERRQGCTVVVRTPDPDRLAEALRVLDPPPDVQRRDGALTVKGLQPADIGHLAFRAGIELHELTAERSDLEDIFFALTNASTIGGARG